MQHSIYTSSNIIQLVRKDSFERAIIETYPLALARLQSSQQNTSEHLILEIFLFMHSLYGNFN